MKTIQATCRVCDQPFATPAYQPAQHCSDTCYRVTLSVCGRANGKTARPPIKKTCAYCGEDYQTRRQASRYCSQICVHWAHRKRSPLEEMAMYERYRAGESLEAIGREQGICGERVRDIFRRNGYEVRRAGRPAKESEQRA